MERFRWIRAALPLLTMLGCSNFLNPEDYEQLPSLEDLDFTSVEPSAPFLLWELREASAGGTHRVLARVASASQNPVPADLMAAFNATTAPNGFDPTCLPGYCYKYFVSLEGTTIRVWNSIDEARAFIGGVNNRVEAALIAKSNGFYWVPPRETSAIREVAGGYELVVLELVRTCDPIQYDRVVVYVSASGALEVRKREVWERHSRVCI